MYLQKLSLLQFKNYAQENFRFSAKINCLTGLNGSGKTNVLDAIHYLGLTKSYFNTIDSQNIMHGQEFMVIEGSFIKNNDALDIYCGVKRNTKKVFRKNKKEYTKMAEHIGLIPMVMISPADYGLILEGSDERRKFLNNVISQFDKVYLDETIRYNRLIQQRNKVLKDLAAHHIENNELIEVLNSQLVPLAKSIHSKRKNFVEELIPTFNNYYQHISEGKESVSLQYESQLTGNDYEQLLKASLQKDRMLQYTAVGVHKDDLVLQMADHPIKKTGSQGQQKTFLIALKLAKFNYIEKLCGQKPVLLLDDIFDKLDKLRVGKILSLVAENQFGQIFITDTNFERLKAILNDLQVDKMFFNIDNGKANVLP